MEANGVHRWYSSHDWPLAFDDLGCTKKLIIWILQFGLHYALPYAALSLPFQLRKVAFPWKPVLAAELAFYLWMVLAKLPSLRATPLEAEAPHGTMLELYQTSVGRVKLADSLGYPWQRWLSGWFLGARPDEIRRDNLVEWIAAMFYSKQLGQLGAAERSEVDWMANDLPARLGWSMQPGRNPAVRSIQVLLDPMRPVLLRSLLQYLVASAMPRLLSAVVLGMLGLRRARCSKTGLRYWWRAPARFTTEPDLILFHGLCGFTGYLQLIARLLRKSSRGAVLFEIEDISLCLNQARPSSRAAVLETARAALDRLQAARHGVRRSCLVVGHSLGTGPASWLLAEPPAPIAGAVFIDPISVMLEMPDVAHSFLYRAPRSAFEWLCFLWCASEPGMQLHFRRRFFWYQHILNPEDVAEIPVAFFLSEKDEIVPSRIVRAFVHDQIKSADVIMWKGIGHTYFMGFPSCHVQISQWIARCPDAHHKWIGR